MNDNEFKVLKHMSDKNERGFPKVYSSGIFQKQPYIILERLGDSLKNIMKRSNRHFSTKCTMTIGIRLLDLLEKLHHQGFIHCDLKPDNVLTGYSCSNELYLIDFGLTNRYLDSSGVHIKFKTNQLFSGNVIYSSKNAFAGVTLSRRDDIISLLYFLIFCINSKQKWIDT
jgi:serine/threonine protein kinase